MNNLNLTPNQRAFCENRFRHPEWTAAECYMRAYPKCTSENAAAVEASKNLKKPKILRYLGQRCEEAASHVGVNAGRILREEARLAFYDPREVVDSATGEVRALHQLPEHIARAIVGLRVIRTQSLRDPDMVRIEYVYKFADKGRALERLSRFLGLYQADNVQKPTPEKVSERLVCMPVNRELTITEWQQQVDEYNAMMAQKKQDPNRAVQ